MLNEFRQYKGHRDIQLRGVSLHVINVPNNKPSPVWMWCLSHFGLPIKKFCFTQIFLVPPSAEPGDDPVAPGLLPTASLPHLAVKYNLCVKGCVPVRLVQLAPLRSKTLPSIRHDFLSESDFPPPFFFFTQEFDLWLWKIIVFFQVDRNYRHNYELHRFFTLLLNDKPLSKFLLCKTLISGLQYDSVWRCDTTRPSSFVIAASQGFRDSRTLLLHSLPSW